MASSGSLAPEHNGESTENAEDDADREHQDNSANQGSPTAEALKENESTSEKQAVSKDSATRPRSSPPYVIYLSPMDTSQAIVVLGYVVVLVAAVATRLYKLNEPDHICWDETHFGKHASWYLNGTFFFDVHPPLGKLLIAASGYLSGYNGSFAFDKPGDKYGEQSYYGMRLMCAVFGALVVPIAYMTVHDLTKSCTAALLASAMLICDTGLLSLTQYILLDPPLICFIIAAVMAAFKFMDCHDEPFSFEWWWWLSITGFTLAFSIGVKFVGLFVILFVGMVTAKDLWNIYGNLKNSLVYVLKHFLARALCLILLPLLVYCGIFYVHFLVLFRSGNGDGFMSSAFQSTLVGNDLYERSVPEDLAFGSVVTLKSHRGGGALLHSHSHLYPEDAGPVQQQVTAYSHKDENNKWQVKRADKEYSEDDPLEYVVSGSIVRLEHIMTKRNMHSHKEKAPMTKSHFQVSGYGKDGVGDANDHWVLEVVGGVTGERVKTVSSVFRLRHQNVGCHLFTHSQQLPKWGWEQHEVTCVGQISDPNTLWNIEGHVNTRLPNVSGEFYKPSFFRKLIESHIVMTESNSNLKPKEGEVTSRPWQWPINFRGQSYSGGDYRIYMLGNPVVFWLADAMLLVFLLTLLIKVFLDKRSVHYDIYLRVCIRTYINGGSWMFLAWLLHYAPFFLMGRVLYFHHYFPAFVFQCMLAGSTVEFLASVMTVMCKRPAVQSVIYHTVVVGTFSSIVYSFLLFMPMSYGMHGPRADDANSTMYGLKWLSSWDI